MTTKQKRVKSVKPHHVELTKDPDDRDPFRRKQQITTASGEEKKKKKKKSERLQRAINEWEAFQRDSKDDNLIENGGRSE